jgi:hypothetical protein
MMTELPFVLLVLFAMPNGNPIVMETTQQFSSPLSCSMRAFIENDEVYDRTYVCVSRGHAATLLENQRNIQLGAMPGPSAK